MDSEEFAVKLNKIKYEAMKGFEEKCKSATHLVDGKETLLTDTLEKEIEKIIEESMKKHNDVIDKNGLKVTYDGKKKVTEKVTILYVEDNSCTELMSFKWNNIYLQLKHVIIRDGCCLRVKSFELSNLPLLETVEIGDNSFTESPNGGGDEGKSFSITECKSLDTISIGRFSFSDYGEFILEDLDNLQHLTIGDRHKKSCNFYHVSFILRSSYLIHC